MKFHINWREQLKELAPIGISAGVLAVAQLVFVVFPDDWNWTFDPGTGTLVFGLVVVILVLAAAWRSEKAKARGETPRES